MLQREVYRPGYNSSHGENKQAEGIMSPASVFLVLQVLQPPTLVLSCGPSAVQVPSSSSHGDFL